MENMDLLSALPMNIIHIILSLLPVRDAIRTSLLSWKWRYIWASLPYLSFHDELPSMKPELKRMDHFISQVLLLHKGPIHKFELTRPMEENSHCNDEWLIFLSRNGIRILVIRSEGSRYLHSSLYSCQYLTHLELQRNKIPPPPQSFKGFLWLRRLDLNGVEVLPSTIETIVDRSPLLEEFILESYRCCELRICAPNLKYFDFGFVGKGLSLCTPLLEEFKGDFFYSWSFNIGSDSFHGPSSEFPHLRIAKLSNVDFKDPLVTQAVIHLSTSSPNLQKLEISGWPCWDDDASELACESLWDTESAADFTYDNLKAIKIENCCGGFDEMKLIRFLLARSPVLEKMMYEPDSDVPDHELANLMAELLSFPRASANAQILIGGKRIRSF